MQTVSKNIHLTTTSTLGTGHAKTLTNTHTNLLTIKGGNIMTQANTSTPKDNKPVVSNDIQTIDNKAVITQFMTDNCKGVKSINNGFILTGDLTKAQGTYRDGNPLAKMVKANKTQLGLCGFDVTNKNYNYAVMWFTSGRDYVPAKIKKLAKHNYFGKNKFVVPVSLLSNADLKSMVDINK